MSRDITLRLCQSRKDLAKNKKGKKAKVKAVK